jgi:predicted phage terminase large subunit-like protein
MSDVTPIGAQPGPQEAFLATSADIAFYGGEAGSGKSAALVLECARNHDLPGFGAIVFRRTTKELAGAGSIWELMRGWFPALGARMKSNPFTATFPSGASVVLDHLQYEEDKFSHQGKGYGLICFDELPHFTESQFWYLWSRARSMSGVRPYMRATMNPTPDSWVKKLIAWYLDDEGRYIRPERSGVLRYFYRVDDSLDWDRDAAALKARHPEQVGADGQQIEPTSFTFILGLLADNKILEQKDPGYRAKLMSLPRVERERLLGRDNRGGDWKIKASAGLFFNRGMFRVVPAAPANLVALVRGWDKAVSEPSAEYPDPDWTRGVKMGVTPDGRYIVLHLASLRGSPHAVDQLQKNTASQDGRTCKVAIWQDPAQAGIVDVTHITQLLAGYWVDVERTSKHLEAFAGPLSTQCEAGNVDVLEGAWNDEFFAELEAFPDGAHDDIVAAAARAFLSLAGAGVLAYQQAMAAVRDELEGMESE